MKLLLASLGVLLVVVLVAVFGLGRPIKWIFPGDDGGWVTVQFNNPSCPPLRTEGVFWVVDVPEQKSTCTSTPLPHGLKYFRFEARQGDATLRLKWGESVWPVTYKEDSGWYLLFVGAKEKFNHSGTMPRPWSH
jgi:hypothetical protein